MTSVVGVSTIIELTAGAATTPQSKHQDAPTEQGAAFASADATVNVTLADYMVTPDAASVKAGAIRFDCYWIPLSADGLVA